MTKTGSDPPILTGHGSWVKELPRSERGKLELTQEKQLRPPSYTVAAEMGRWSQRIQN